MAIGGLRDRGLASFEATMRGLATYRETGNAPKAFEKTHPFASSASNTHDASCFSSLLSDLVMAMAAAPDREARD
jgi:hypothetical protein